ncbi:hypothetical protein ATCC90586_006033 [Pythium insidiosum]|nr:hypothetical protein ATCC90586_006033 [Pythium insidiosum]
MSFLRRALVSMEAAVLSSKQYDQPSAVFSGRLSLACQPTEVGVVRSGYCAVRGSIPRDLLLHGYEGLTMRVMTDGREYRLNAQMDGWNPLNLYMLPFRDFLLTTKGYYKYDDPTPLDPGKLRSIGIAIADQKEGDFEIRVQWIKAIAKVESREVSDEEIEARYQQQHLRTRKNLKKPDGISI